MKNTLSFFLSILVVMSFCTFASAEIRLKYGLSAPPTHPHAKSSLFLSEYVKEKTKGQVIIDVFPLGQLGSGRSMVEQVQGGTLDIADVTSAVVSPFAAPTGLLDLPFLWPSRGVAYSVLHDTEFFNIYRDMLRKKDLVMIGYGENEFRDLTNIKREVRRPEDVKGLKIRVMEAPIFMETWRTLGANPVPMPFGEVYTGLQQGVIDAQENPLYTSILMKFTEVCPYATSLQYSLSSTIKLMSVNAWGKLTSEQQEILMQAARLAVQKNREENMNIVADTVGQLEAEGKVKVTYLSKSERDAFVEAVQPVYARFEKETGKIPNDKKYGRFAGMSYFQLFQEKIKQYQ
ncbi:TRAP transporter substrate-binding protein DctP [bacterium]|nr:TRAP transporter substrate-binding protein DctP [bacterium]